MKISYNWLSTYIKTDLNTNKVGEILTNIGLEVEGVKEIGSSKPCLDGVVVGKVITLEKHPNADKLKVATVDIGKDENLQIVCGAPNIEEEQKVAVATIGTVLKLNDGNTLTIKQAKLRKVDSFGMICSQAELGLSDDHDGIWILEPSVKIGTPISDLIDTPSEDTQFEIGLTPNRTDAMSHYGVARDLNAALQTLKLKSEFINNNFDEFDELYNNVSAESPISIEVESPNLAPRYAGIYLENIQVKPSPDWLQENLKAIDIQPINNVVDITNYILHDLGQPLHAFDAAKITDHKIIVKTLKEGTEFTTLDGVKRKLNGSELMICDTKGGLCMAGVYGGLESGVTEKTNAIFLESAYFDPISIRKSSKYHGLNTDSSFRFERGIDPKITIDALKKAVILLVRYANAKIGGKIQEIYPQPIENFKVVLRYHKVDQLLGERIHRESIKKILDLLEIKVNSETNEVLELEVPAYRFDVRREVDVIEEILRIYGYNNIKTPDKVSFSIIKNQFNDRQKLENIAANFLVYNGFYEAMNNSLIKSNWNSKLEIDEDKNVKMLNPLSSDLALMRQTMLPGLLENAAFNINRKHSNLKLFEIGKTYQKIDKSYKETYQLAILLSGNLHGESWTQPTQKSNFFHLKGIVEQLFNRLGFQNIQQAPNLSNWFSEAITLTFEGKELGVLGIVNKPLTKFADINQEVYFTQLNWEIITNIASEFKVKFKEITKFPAVRRDLALLIDQSVKYVDIYNSTQKLNLELLKSIQLFDVYEGDKLPEGKKSYAMSFMLQDERKTLSDSEIEKTMNELIRNFQQNFNAELRN